MSELSELMENRATMYDFLSRIYKVEVDEEFLSELKQTHYPQNTGNESIDEAYRRIHAFLCRARENTLNTLAVDYARIFLGCGSLDAEAAYPFESVYTSPKHLTMQDARDEVLAIYRSEGFGKSSLWKEPEDHIAVELEFIKALSLKTKASIDGKDAKEAFRLVETQLNFIENHITTWLPRFVDDVKTYAKKDFYPAFADLTLAYLQEDVALLKSMIDDESEE